MPRQFLTQEGKPAIDKAFNGLKVVTRTYEVNGGATAPGSIEAEVFLPYGTADEEFATALLVKRGMAPVTNAKNAYILRLTEVYQEFTAGQKVSVGEDQIIRLEDGREALVRRYVALASEAEGLAADVGDILGGRACQEAKINKQGVGAEIVETYISSGKLKESDSDRNNEKLKLKTLVYFNEVPPTPSGYVLWDTDVSGPEGLPTYTYSFAQGDGEIDRDISYGQSDDEGVTGVTRTSIVHLTASSVNTNPTSAPAGQALIDIKKSDENGYRVWRVTYAKGVGVVLVDTATRSMGKFKTYRIVQLGSAPTAPSATLGGSVTLFDTSVRKDSGYDVYDYRWTEVEPGFEVGIRVSARDDGSLVYTITELDTIKATPDYPGSGTGHLTDLDQNRDDTNYRNRATYIKPPPDETLKQPWTFNMPGTLQFESGISGHNLLISPSKQIPLQADVEISYGTTQIDDAHYYVVYGAFLNYSYIREGQTIGEFKQQPFSNHVSSGGSVSGSSGDKLNGVACEEYDATLHASSPTTRPSGLTVLSPPKNERYLTAIDGTVVYRRIKATYTF